MSSTGPDDVGPADWGRTDWTTLAEELRAIAVLAGELRLWTVLGSLHPLTPPRRPHLSLYVISDDGAITTRYDERMLSNTKVSHMYTPGSAPVTFTVDGVRFGCALGMEAVFPEVFLEYERLDVDCVLFSTHGPGTAANKRPVRPAVTGARRREQLLGQLCGHGPGRPQRRLRHHHAERRLAHPLPIGAVSRHHDGRPGSHRRESLPPVAPGCPRRPVRPVPGPQRPPKPRPSPPLTRDRCRPANPGRQRPAVEPAADSARSTP